MENQDGQILTNPDFDFPFAGKTYKVKKVNLRQVMDFQRKVVEIQKDNDAAGDLRMVSYAIWIVLNAVDKNTTEDWVIDNCPGDIDVVDIFIKFGFMSQRKTAMLGNLSNLLVKKPNGENSSV